MSTHHKTTHGQTGSATYSTWTSMKWRVAHHKRYKEVSLCERWRKFENFLEDMGERPDGTSLDRIDNGGDYCPENCRWATIAEQNNNKNGNHRLEWNGETKTIAEWARDLQINHDTLKGRIFRGWSVERAFTTPTRKYTPPIVLTHEGVTLTVSEWSERTGIKATTIRRRVTRYGWSVEKALTTPAWGG